MSETCDALFVGAHPDDIEIGCGGLILRLRAAGRTVVLMDLTGGEMGSRGDAETRQREAEAACNALDATARVNLGLPDAGVRDDEPSLQKFVAELRRLRPRLLVTHYWVDRHPDHVAAAQLTDRAFFHAGLQRYQPELGAPWRPKTVLYYPGNDHAEPSVCFDISAQLQQKLTVVSCYASQITEDGQANVGGISYLQRVTTRDQYCGSRIGVDAAEGYVLRGPVALDPLWMLDS